MDDNIMGIRPQVDESPTRGILPHPDNLRTHDKHSVWRKLHSFFGRDDRRQSPIPCPASEAPQWGEDQQKGVGRDWSTRRVVGLPRQATFRRQNSEKREHLLPVQPCNAERRAVSASRHTSITLTKPRSKSSPAPIHPARTSAPAVAHDSQRNQPFNQVDDCPHFDEPISPMLLDGDGEAPPESDNFRPARPPSVTSSHDYDHDRFPEMDERAQLNLELDSKWILNLSMHFRDKSDREKFFVTYAEQPNRWRRVTVSCDYRNAEPGSLEMDLKELKFQRDKSLQVYESIRDSLPDISFYDTVTNLKLETTDGRLHVHVTEDVNEIIPYPPKTTVAHVLESDDFRPMEVVESDLVFDSHLSGFVYKVSYAGKTYIKKEIPGPDTVDEFLYEINALHALHGSRYVIQLEAIVVDDSREFVKGLLISYAERGAVVDLLYDQKGEILWEDRVRWAQQAVQGLSEIHGEGYVQGDFTLSNIVVDQDNNAQIIDINRRGCPVGWEPPEIAKKIASNQRISMYIGEKSDIYQLGMTLWALAMDDDEPERHDPPLSTDEFPSEVPEWYQDVIRICLAAEPRDRLSAKEVLRLFQNAPTAAIRPPLVSRVNTSRTERQYIDPAAAVERDDIERLTRNQSYQDDLTYTSASSFDDYTFTYPRSSNYEFESGSSQIERPRGRRPPTSSAQQNENHDVHRSPPRDESSTLDGGDLEPLIISISPGREPRFEEPEFHGYPSLIPRNAFDSEDTRSLGREQVGPLEDHSIERDPFSERIESAPPVSEHRDVPPVTEDIELDPPIAEDSPSGTSESTPRNAQPILDIFASTAPSSLELDLSATILAGLGSHPVLDQHSPHEPKAMYELGLSVPSEASEQPPLADKVPPGLPFGDSGYDESLGFPVHHEASLENGDPLGFHDHHETSLQNEDLLASPEHHEISLENNEPMGFPEHHEISLENDEPLGVHEHHETSLENDEPLGVHEHHEITLENDEPLAFPEHHETSLAIDELLGVPEHHETSLEIDGLLGVPEHHETSLEIDELLGVPEHHETSLEIDELLGVPEHHGITLENAEPLSVPEHHETSLEIDELLGVPEHHETNLEIDELLGVPEHRETTLENDEPLGVPEHHETNLENDESLGVPEHHELSLENDGLSPRHPETTSMEDEDLIFATSTALPPDPAPPPSSDQETVVALSESEDAELHPPAEPFDHVTLPATQPDQAFAEDNLTTTTNSVGEETKSQPDSTVDELDKLATMPVHLTSPVSGDLSPTRDTPIHLDSPLLPDPAPQPNSVQETVMAPPESEDTELQPSAALFDHVTLPATQPDQAFPENNFVTIANSVGEETTSHPVSTVDKLDIMAITPVDLTPLTSGDLSSTRETSTQPASPLLPDPGTQPSSDQETIVAPPESEDVELQPPAAPFDRETLPAIQPDQPFPENNSAAIIIPVGEELTSHPVSTVDKLDVMATMPVHLTPPTSGDLSSTGETSIHPAFPLLPDAAGSDQTTAHSIYPILLCDQNTFNPPLPSTISNPKSNTASSLPESAFTEENLKTPIPSTMSSSRSKASSDLPDEILAPYPEPATHHTQQPSEEPSEQPSEQ